MAAPRLGAQAPIHHLCYRFLAGVLSRDVVNNKPTGTKVGQRSTPDRRPLTKRGRENPGRAVLFGGLPD